MESQSNLILAAMQKGMEITPMDALMDFGCFRLSGRIYDLKKRGYEIKSKDVKIGKKIFSAYYMEQP